MPAMFIDDGYTLDATIAGTPGVHPPLGITYRPALSAAVEEYLLAKKDTGPLAVQAKLKFMLKHLVNWDATDADGKLLPVREDLLRKLPHPVMQRIVDILCGYPREGEIGGDSPELVDAKN